MQQKLKTFKYISTGLKINSIKFGLFIPVRIFTENTRILEQQNNKQNLQILEALHIRNKQPKLSRIKTLKKAKGKCIIIGFTTENQQERDCPLSGINAFHILVTDEAEVVEELFPLGKAWEIQWG